MLGRGASTDRATTLFPGRGAVVVGAEQCSGKRVVSRSVLFWFWRGWAGFWREGAERAGVSGLPSPEEVSILEELSAARKNLDVTFASGSKDRGYGKLGLELEGQLAQLFTVLLYAFPLQQSS